MINDDDDTISKDYLVGSYRLEKYYGVVSSQKKTILFDFEFNF